ncbi:glycerophosphoryl diester phosphodiesterase membrane domain-containing protein [uncultured Arthrobacter sp.]|uniref:glycerophosphoryl diester phosphodiesterase membrane domain-containing protein n=1 Tax=uncultured Arthrobacter sp. TaxID=114050 RepID=UPI0026180180|nr:glycerophosphoryl diester phosphodiesterase membrane domain-containing protein [uncultured Arthrobacter sp.]
MSGNFPEGEPEDRPWQSPSGPQQWGQNQQPAWGQNQARFPEQAAGDINPGWPVPPPGQFHGYQAPPKPGIIPLRPLGLGEILDGAFQACRRNPLSTFGTAILFQVIVAVLTVLLTIGLTGSLATFDPFTASSAEVTGLVASALSVGSVLILLTSVGVLILQGVLIIPIARAVLDERTGFGQLWKLAGRRILPLVGLGAILLLLWTVSAVVLVLILVGLSLALEDAAVAIVVIGVLAAVAVAIWLNIKWIMAPAALMLEGVGPIGALRRSWTLTTGNWWRTFGILVLTSIIVSIITQVVAAPVSFLAFGLGSFTSAPASTEAALLESLPVLLIVQAVTAVFTAIGFAFQAGVTALLYVDLRIRREGFDIVLLRENEARTKGTYSPIPGQSTGGEYGHPGPQGPSTGPGA